MKKFFITCSGYDRDILSQCPESENTKAVGIGATIFLTAVLAAISGGYAIYFTFESVFASLAFALLWGAIIFNLDRYIVSGIRKQGKPWKELWYSFPRIIIAVLLAITISKPLELKLFAGSIEKHLGSSEDAYNQNCEASFNKQVNDLTATKQSLQKQIDLSRGKIYSDDPLLKDIQQQIGTLDMEANSFSDMIDQNKFIINKNSTYDSIKKYRKYNSEALKRMNENVEFSKTIKSDDEKISNLKDSVIERKERLGNQVKTIETQYLSQIQATQSQIDDLSSNRNKILDKCKGDASQDKDLLSRMKALGSLKDENYTAWLASMFITILFVLIEAAPVIVKLMSSRGMYDKIFDREEEEGFIKQDRILEEKKDALEKYDVMYQELNKIRNDLRIRGEKLRTESELKAINYTHSQILETQNKISQAVIDKWYKEECAKLGVKEKPIKKNPRKKK